LGRAEPLGRKAFQRRRVLFLEGAAVNAGDPSDEIRARLQTAIQRLERFAHGSGSLRQELLDVLVVVGLAEHELELIKSVVRHALRAP
jgi:hypothetical protein